MQGIDPRTSHMLSERSTIWATSPSENQDVFKIIYIIKLTLALYFTVIVVIFNLYSFIE